MYTLCFTGHRQIQGQYYNGSANGAGVWANIYHALYAQILFAYDKRNVTTFIAGGALGVDMLASQAVLGLKALRPEVKLVIARPFPSQACKWPKSMQTLAAAINGHAEVTDVSSDPYDPKKMIIRDQWMVDRSDYVLAVKEADKIDGGTVKTIQYARVKQKMLGVMDPITLNIVWSKG